MITYALRASCNSHAEVTFYVLLLLKLFWGPIIWKLIESSQENGIVGGVQLFFSRRLMQFGALTSILGNCCFLFVIGTFVPVIKNIWENDSMDPR